MYLMLIPLLIVTRINLSVSDDAIQICSNFFSTFREDNRLELQLNIRHDQERAKCGCLISHPDNHTLTFPFETVLDASLNTAHRFEENGYRMVLADTICEFHQSDDFCQLHHFDQSDDLEVPFEGEPPFSRSPYHRIVFAYERIGGAERNQDVPDLEFRMEFASLRYISLECRQVEPDIGSASPSATTTRPTTTTTRPTTTTTRPTTTTTRPTTTTTITTRPTTTTTRPTTTTTGPTTTTTRPTTTTTGTTTTTTAPSTAATLSPTSVLISNKSIVISNRNAPGDQSKIGMAVGIVLAVVAIFVVIAVILFILIRRKKYLANDAVYRSTENTSNTGSIMGINNPAYFMGVNNDIYDEIGDGKNNMVKPTIKEPELPKGAALMEYAPDAHYAHLTNAQNEQNNFYAKLQMMQENPDSK